MMIDVVWARYEGRGRGKEVAALMVVFSKNEHCLVMHRQPLSALPYLGYVMGCGSLDTKLHHDFEGCGKFDT